MILLNDGCLSELYLQITNACMMMNDDDSKKLAQLFIIIISYIYIIMYEQARKDKKEITM